MRGRLVWNTASSSGALTKEMDRTLIWIATSSIDDLLVLLSANPSVIFDNPGQVYTVSAYMKYALEPSVEDDLLTLRILKVHPWLDKHSGHDPGPRATWLEAGQA